MERPDIDWGVLRGAMLVAAVSVVVGGLLLWGGHWYRTSAEDDFETEQRRFLAQSRRYLAVDEEEGLIREYLPSYRRLEAVGVVGDEQRLAWSEALREVSKDLGIPSMRYEIQPQGQYQAPADVHPGSFQTYGSRMKLYLGLFHEDDLFRILNELRQRAPGMFLVEECVLRRVSRELQTDPSRPNVDAQCDLMWVTLRKPQEGQPR